MKPRVLVTRVLSDRLDARLREHADVEAFPGPGAPSCDQLVATVPDKQGILCLLTDPISARVIDAAPSLEIIANIAVGYDNIDVAHAASRGILVTNTPDVLTEAVADFTWALILAITRRLGEGERYVRAARFRGWDPGLLLGTDLRGKTLGIVGFGRIGCAVAARAPSFGMRIVATGSSRPARTPVLPLDDLLRTSDVVTIHAPLRPETRHLIGGRELGLMKPTAYLVNTARGPLVDEAALAESLRAGRLAGAALDVYEREPAITPALLDLENVVLAPHIGSATAETREAMASLAIDNLLAGLEGTVPPNLVTPPVANRPNVSPES